MTKVSRRIAWFIVAVCATGIVVVISLATRDIVLNRGDDTTLLVVPSMVMVLVGGRMVRRLYATRQSAPRSPQMSRVAEIVSPLHPILTPKVAREGTSSSRVLSQIEIVRDLLGPHPRTFEPEIRQYLEAEPPAWLKRSPKDEMNDPFRNRETILRDGRVVWAAIVQANNQIFKRGSVDVGASVVFSEDPWFDERPQELRRIAADLYQLKGTDQNDPDVSAIARMLTSELMRGVKMPVPARFTTQRRVFHSPIMLVRKHLPKGFLADQIFPALVDAEGKGQLILVPAAFWPASLLHEWDQ
jgi:hypothetical protein